MDETNATLMSGAELKQRLIDFERAHYVIPVVEMQNEAGFFVAYSQDVVMDYKEYENLRDAFPFKNVSFEYNKRKTELRGYFFCQACGGPKEYLAKLSQTICREGETWLISEHIDPNWKDACHKIDRLLEEYFLNSYPVFRQYEKEDTKIHEFNV